MKDKERMRGTFRLYLQWPLVLSVLWIILTAVVGTVSLQAGIIVSVFTLVYIGIALWLYFSRKRGILGGLIAFASSYEEGRNSLMQEMLIPYAVTDDTGRILWMNREFEAVFADDKITPRNVTAMFPEVTKEHLATQGELISVHSSFGESNYRIDLKEMKLDGLENEGACVTAVYLIDETQTLKYMQQDRKSVV